MHATANRHGLTLPSALAASVVSGCIAGLAVAALYAGMAPAPAGLSAAAITGNACRACGVVEEVRRVENPQPGKNVSTVVASRDEGIVMLLVALGGVTLAPPPAALYEVSVRMADGSLRTILGQRPPRWQTGDPVKVVKGEIEARTTR